MGRLKKSWKQPWGYIIIVLPTCPKMKIKKEVSPLYMMNAYFVNLAGRLVFLGNGGDAQKPSPSELKSVGYY